MQGRRTVWKSGGGWYIICPPWLIGFWVNHRLLDHGFTGLPKSGGNGRSPPGSVETYTYTSSLLRKNSICMKIGMIFATDYGHMNTKSLILCGPNSNTNLLFRLEFCYWFKEMCTVDIFLVSQAKLFFISIDDDIVDKTFKVEKNFDALSRTFCIFDSFF